METNNINDELRIEINREMQFWDENKGGELKLRCGSEPATLEDIRNLATHFCEFGVDIMKKQMIERACKILEYANAGTLFINYFRKKMMEEE